MFADDEECDSSNAVRYAVLPSLVALQQMRNRLHLAFVGKKLMTWTATATARELRKMALELNEAYQTFRDDMRQCFILLARARYFNPEINKIVLENLCKDAGIKIQKTSKSIAGVKVLQSHILDYGFDSYEFLGIGRGGTAINEAKKAWRDLLKRMIFMCQMRCGFTDVEQANKNATKRQNVLQRIVMPRTMVTMKYILDQLEEREREDFYRIKKILANKMKAKKLKPMREGRPEQVESMIEVCICEEPIEIKKPIDKEVKLKHAEEIIPGVIAVCSCEKNKESVKTTDDEDFGLGVREIEVIETTKIIRVKNEDGTVSEKKKFITKKREKITALRPDNVTSAITDRYDSFRTESKTSKALSQSSDRTVGVVTLNEPRVMRSKTQSTLPLTSPMTDSFDESNLISTQSYVISNNVSNHSVYSVCENSKDCLRMSSTKIEEMLQLHELRDYHNMIQTSSEFVNASKEMYCLSDSEIKLLNNQKNIKKLNKSKSNDEMKHKVTYNKILRSYSNGTEDFFESINSSEDKSLK